MKLLRNPMLRENKNFLSVYPQNNFSSVKKLVQKAYENSEYYKSNWSKSLQLKNFNSWSDFFKLQPSDKSVFKKENISVDESEIAFYFFSGGTTDKPKVIPVTKQEWKSRNMYRADCYQLAGLTEFDSVWIALPFGPWAAGHSVQHAFHILKSNVLPAGLSNDQHIMKYIWQQVKRMNINVIATTPSILSFIESSIDLDSFFPVEKVITTGEYISSDWKNHYKEKYKVDVFASYGASECFIGIECSKRCGYHYNPDNILVEVVDQNNFPTTGEGTILLTNLASEAIPLVRYKIGDRGKIHTKKCVCGSDWPRLEWIGRDSDFYEISGGVNFHMHQLSDALRIFSSKLKKCEVRINNGHTGKDFIEFKIFFNKKEINTKIKRQKLVEQVTKAIQNLSLDFNDVMFEGYANIKINIKEDKSTGVYQKARIKIYDLRRFRR